MYNYLKWLYGIIEDKISLLYLVMIIANTVSQKIIPFTEKQISNNKKQTNKY